MMDKASIKMEARFSVLPYLKAKKPFPSLSQGYVMTAILTLEVHEMKDLNTIQLTILYNNFVIYRDKFCNGWAKMSVQDFYNKFKLSQYQVKK
jgi:hypothetical protein